MPTGLVFKAHRPVHHSTLGLRVIKKKKKGAGQDQYAGRSCCCSCARDGMCSSSEAGSYVRLIYSCTTQLQAQGPSRTCNESKEEEGEGCRARPVCRRLLLLPPRARCLPGEGLLHHRSVQRFRGGLVFKAHRLCVSLNSRLESNKEEERVPS